MFHSSGSLHAPNDLRMFIFMPQIRRVCSLWSVHFPWPLPVRLFPYNCLKAWHLCGWQPTLTVFLWLLSACRGYAVLHMVTHLHRDNSCRVACREFPTAALHEESTRAFLICHTPDTCLSPQRGTRVRHFSVSWEKWGLCIFGGFWMNFCLDVFLKYSRSCFLM